MWTVGGAWSKPTSHFQFFLFLNPILKSNMSAKEKYTFVYITQKWLDSKGGWGPKMSKMVGTNKARQQQQGCKISMERQIELQVKNTGDQAQKQSLDADTRTRSTQDKWGQRHKHTIGVETIRAVATKDKGGYQDRKWQGGIGPPLMTW